MASFSVILLTAPPPGLPDDAIGAFVKIDGRECVLRSSELFLNRDAIGQIQLVVSAAMQEEAKRKFGAHLSFSGVKLVVGGAGWYSQLEAASKAITEHSTHVIVHDAARPIVASTDIDALLEAAEKYDAIALSQPLRNELVEVDEGGNPVGYRAAGDFTQLLTPQSYGRETFLAMAKSGTTPHASGLHLLPGLPFNIRINRAGDAGIAKAMLGLNPKPKSKAPLNPFDEAQW
jgi:2-C-methyl-D-erythritol 4-phosphate cytidylyltransferase